MPTIPMTNVNKTLGWTDRGLIVYRGPYLSQCNCIRILWQKMKCIRILSHKWILTTWIHSILKKKMYSYSSFFNVFVFGSPKIKSIQIRPDTRIVWQSVSIWNLPYPRFIQIEHCHLPCRWYEIDTVFESCFRVSKKIYMPQYVCRINSFPLNHRYPLSNWLLQYIGWDMIWYTALGDVPVWKTSVNVRSFIECHTRQNQVVKVKVSCFPEA